MSENIDNSKEKSKNKKIPFKVLSKRALAIAMSIAVLGTSASLLTACGEPGEKGADGKSAYELAVDNGYTGTLEQWLESLKGATGAKGDASTFAVSEGGYWIINGETTTYKAIGTNGATPYIRNGNWWINGEDTGISANGLEGKSAYQVAVDGGFVGSEAEWLASLKGEQGTSWLTGIIDPSDDQGRDGDVYLNTLTCDLFVKKSGSWGDPICNIKGETGQDGYDRVYISKTGNATTPVFIDEEGASLYDFNYNDEQKVTVHGVNRLNVENAQFTTSGYNTTHTFERENNGLTITTTARESALDSVYVSCEYTAEFTGTLWLSCDAECTGDITDVGMRMSVNGTAQNLSRGTGRLAESVIVEKGDTIKLTFYARIGTSGANVIKYKNIMLQYNVLTDYIPYAEDLSNYSNEKTIVLDGSEDLTWTTTSTNATASTSDGEERYYAVYTQLDATEFADGVLPTDNNAVASIEVEGCELLSYNSVYANNIGVGINSSGKLLLYVGAGYTKANIGEYLAQNPITITYKVSEYKYVGFGKTPEITTGNVITSDAEFTVNYTYLAQKKTSK